jgi:hypothetical protein
MKTLKFLKLYENFIILNTGIFLNHMTTLEPDQYEVLWSRVQQY